MPTKINILRLVLLVGAFSLVLLLAGWYIVQAEATTRSGSATVGKFDYVELYDNEDATATCTNSTDYADIPGMTKTFSQGGLIANEAIVDFSSRFNGSSAADSIYIRLLVDGVVQLGAGSEKVFSVPFAAGSATHHFVSAPLSPGNHTARLQWKVSSGLDNGVCIGSRAMIIHHR